MSGDPYDLVNHLEHTGPGGHSFGDVAGLDLSLLRGAHDADHRLGRPHHTHDQEEAE